jgi:hypothetical protein
VGISCLSEELLASQEGLSSMEWGNIVIPNKNKFSVFWQAGSCYRQVHAHNIGFLLYIKEIHSITHELTKIRTQFFTVLQQKFKVLL